MISIDGTVFIHILNMIVLMVMLNKILYQPILEILDRRRANLEALNGDVDRIERHARDRQAEVDLKMQQAGATAKKALDAARTDAEKAGAERLAAIRQEAEAAKERHLAEIRTGLEATRQELLADVEEFAKEIAVKVLGRSLQA